MTVSCEGLIELGDTLFSRTKRLNDNSIPNVEDLAIKHIGLDKQIAQFLKKIFFPIWMGRALYHRALLGALRNLQTKYPMMQA